MAVKVTSPTGLEWKLQRLWLPLAMRPVSPGGAVRVHQRGTVRSSGVSAGEGFVFGLLLSLLMLPLLPVVLFLRGMRMTPWTLQATARPWGRRGPRQLMRWEVKGWAESEMALQLLVEGFTKGDGAPEVPIAARIT